MRQMLAALKCCHEHYIGHFDVKPETPCLHLRFTLGSSRTNAYKFINALWFRRLGFFVDRCFGPNAPLQLYSHGATEAKIMCPKQPLHSIARL